MSGCCRSVKSVENEGRPVRLLTAAPAGGLACGVLWLLCPKCPACVAGYLAIAGGISISIPTLGYVLSGLRGAWLAAIGVGAGVLAWRLVRSFVR